MKRFLAWVMLVDAVLFVNAAVAQSATLPAGTPIRVRLMSNLDSKTSHVGDTVLLEVLEPVVVDGVTVIKTGGAAHGEVTEAKRAGRVGHGGKLAFTILDVTAVDGQRVLVSASPHRSQGDGSAGAITAGVVATAVFVPVVAPVWLLKRGHETELNSGQVYTVYTTGDSAVRGVPPPPRPVAAQPPAVPLSPETHPLASEQPVPQVSLGEFARQLRAKKAAEQHQR